MPLSFTIRLIAVALGIVFTRTYLLIDTDSKYEILLLAMLIL